MRQAPVCLELKPPAWPEQVQGPAAARHDAESQHGPQSHERRLPSPCWPLPQPLPDRTGFVRAKARARSDRSNQARHTPMSAGALRRPAYAQIVLVARGSLLGDRRGTPGALRASPTTPAVAAAQQAFRAVDLQTAVCAPKLGRSDEPSFAHPSAWLVSCVQKLLAWWLQHCRPALAAHPAATGCVPPMPQPSEQLPPRKPEAASALPLDPRAAAAHPLSWGRRREVQTRGMAAGSGSTIPGRLGGHEDAYEGLVSCPQGASL